MLQLANENGSSCWLISRDFLPGSESDMTFPSFLILSLSSLSFYASVSSLPQPLTLTACLYLLQSACRSVSLGVCQQSAIRIQCCDSKGKKSTDDASQRAEVGSSYSVSDMLEIKKLKTEWKAGRGSAGYYEQICRCSPYTKVLNEFRCSRLVLCHEKCTVKSSKQSDHRFGKSNNTPMSELINPHF